MLPDIVNSASVAGFPYIILFSSVMARKVLECSYSPLTIQQPSTIPRQTSVCSRPVQTRSILIKCAVRAGPYPPLPSYADFKAGCVSGQGMIAAECWASAGLGFDCWVDVDGAVVRYSKWSGGCVGCCEDDWG